MELSSGISPTFLNAMAMNGARDHPVKMNLFKDLITEETSFVPKADNAYFGLIFFLLLFY